MKARVALFFVCFSLHCWATKVNNLQFNQISTKDGLSQNSVRTIIADKRGYIWAGTLDGLNRYDGYRLITFKPQIGNVHSLVDHRIRDLQEDVNGYLWIKTYKNEFSCYDPSQEKFVNYRGSDTTKILTSFTDFHETTNGDVWLWGNSYGCLHIHNHEGQFTSTPVILNPDLQKKGGCNFFIEDSKSDIWLGYPWGLYHYSDGKTQLFFENEHGFTGAIELNNKIYFTTSDAHIVEYDMKRKTFKLTSNQVKNDAFTNVSKLSNNELLITSSLSGISAYSINSRTFRKPSWAQDAQLKGTVDFIIDRNEGIWMYNHTGYMWYYSPATQTTKKFQLISSDLMKIIDLERYNVFIDSKGLIWITTYGNGLYCYNPDSDVLSNYKYSANENSPASNYLLSITEDKYGNLWVGSEYAGIIKVVKPSYDVQIVRPEPEVAIGRSNNIRSIYNDIYNQMWIGTKNGNLYTYDEHLTTIISTLKNINPYTVAEDSTHMLWVGSKGLGVYIINPKDYQIVSHYTSNDKDSTSLSSNLIFSIFRDSKNRMWVGSFGGGLNLGVRKGSKIQFKHFFSNDNNSNRKYTRYIYQDSKGLIWACTSDGIIRFNPDELIQNANAFTIFKLDLTKKNTLNCNDIKTVYEDEDGIIWIGTAGGGLNKYVEATQQTPEHFVAYTSADGLAGDVITGIMEDEDHNLWISSENGITKFNKKQNTMMIYNFSEHTYGNDFNENTNLYRQNGDMLWGSLDGMLVFNPKSFVPNKNTPLVTLTNFSINDHKVNVATPGSPLKYSIGCTQNIQLKYTQNTFTIEFATLALKEPSKNEYTYILENYDKKWSVIGNNNWATYKNLPPGKYIFKVKGANSDGIWNDNNTQLNIVIAPPLWRSTGAYCIYVLFILLALFFIIKLIHKFNSLNNNIRVERELTSYKLRFFTNISHEFRTPLTLIRGAVEIINDHKEVPESIRKQINLLGRNSNILTKLIDQLLEFRKLQSNVPVLDLEETDIIEFTNDIFLGFRELAIQQEIEYSFSHSKESYLMFIDRRKMDKILYNLLSNAFKFTPKKGKIELSIVINVQNQTCTLSVRDNGIGVSKEKQDQLFSRFMQIHFSSSGTGIGLSLVKEFVEVHKGKIWYENNNNQGSVFNVELSTNPELFKGENFVASTHSDILPDEKETRLIHPNTATSKYTLPEIEDSTLRNYKMLVIDDNDDIRNFLIDEFSQYFMVDVAENGKEGLQKAIEHNPDLIICDVMMAEMDGFEVTRRMKDDFQTCHIPIILLTAHSSTEHQLEGIESGADAYIMKPFSLKYLTTRVFKLIEQREQLKKRFSNEYILDGNLITTTDKDKEFYNLIEQILEEHLDDTNLSVDKFAELAKQRRTIFYKKVKGITGLSPNEFIKIKRLKKAAELLLGSDLTVSEVSYKVGFEDPFYFSKCFKAQYQCSPSKYGQAKAPDPSTSQV